MQGRLYRSDSDDLPRMLALIQQRWVELQPEPWDLHPGDLLWNRFMHEDQISRWYERVLLWEAGDRLIGFADYYPKYREVGLFPLAEVESDAGVIGQMLDDIRELARAFANEGPEDGPTVLTAFVGTALEGTVRKLGLQLVDSESMRMNARPLEDGSLPDAPLPEGWSIRPLLGEGEHAGRAAVHQAAFSPSKATVDGYARMRTQAGYDPELDLVAVDADGTIASFALAWFDPVTKTGLFEPVGTLPEYQRRGLARAVLVEGLRRLRDRGANRAYVNCMEDSPGACRLYESVGFQGVGRWSTFGL
jgi:GNAT superfamily N-acetyltransferase